MRLYGYQINPKTLQILISTQPILHILYSCKSSFRKGRKQHPPLIPPRWGKQDNHLCCHGFKRTRHNKMRLYGYQINPKTLQILISTQPILHILNSCKSRFRKGRKQHPPLIPPSMGETRQPSLLSCVYANETQ